MVPLKRLIYLVIGVVLLAACTPGMGPLPSTGATNTPTAGVYPLAGTNWTLVSFGKTDQQVPVIAGSTITLEFNPDGQAGGTGGCNSYGASYQVQGDTLSFGQIISTLMACQQEGIGDQEQRYFQALKSAGRFELAGDHLTIWYDNGQGVLNFVSSASVPTAAPGATISPTVVPTEAPTLAPTIAPTTPPVQATSTPERITFQPGATSATVTGHLAASGSRQYLLAANAGQTMTVDLSFARGKAILVIWGADGNVLMSDHAEATHFQGVLPTTQDYNILLKGSPESETDYSMTVAIPSLGPNQPTPTPERITFQPGATSATVTGHLPAFGYKPYILAASAGQTMTVELSFTKGEAILVIYGADGNVLISDHAEATQWEGVLPTTQDYHIDLKGNPNGDTDYTLVVTIK